MRSYIDSDILQRLVVDAFTRGVIVAAICHGVLLAARSVDPGTGHSVLYGRKTTALTWAMERLAWRLTRVTRFWDPDYYRTYTEEPGQPGGYMSVQSEVTRALEIRRISVTSYRGSPHWWLKSSGMVRDTATDSRPAFVVDDGSYVSARWPGDTHTFAGVAVATSSRVYATPFAVRPPVLAEEREDPAPRVLGGGLVVAETGDAKQRLGGQLFAKLCPTPG